MSETDREAVPLACAACCKAPCAWSARTLRKSARVDSTDEVAMRKRTATGRPLEVITRSSLAADFNHAPAGFLFNSLQCLRQETNLAAQFTQVPRPRARALR